MTSVTFLFGCWIGCMVGMFLAGALAAARDEVATEAERSPFPMVSSHNGLQLMDDAKV